MKSYSFRTIIEKDGRQYHGFVPALLGCHTYGKTIEETKKNLNEAIEGYLISSVKHGDPIPILRIFKKAGEKLINLLKDKK